MAENEWSSAANYLSGLAGFISSEKHFKDAQKFNREVFEAQLAENERNRQYNSSEAAIARNFQADFSREMFDKTNAYNSPANQVALMKSAGLNPSLMYSGSNFVPASMPGSPSGQSSYSGSVSGSAAPAYDSLSGTLALQRQQAEIDNIEASTQKIESDIVGQDYQNDILKSDAAVRDAFNQGIISLQGVEIDLKSSSIHLTDEEANKARAEFVRLQQDAEAFVKQMELLQLDIDLKEVDKFYKSKEYEAILDKMSADAGLSRAQARSIFEKLPHEINELGTRAALNNALATAAKYQGVKATWETRSIRLGLKDAEDFNSFMDMTGKFGSVVNGISQFTRRVSSFAIPL